MRMLAKQEALEKLEALLKPILSPRQSLDKIESSIVSLSDTELQFTLHWADIVAVSNIELAYTFSTKVGKAAQVMNIECLEQWLKKSLSVYDKEGLYPAVKVLQNLESFKKKYLQSRYSCKLEEVKPRLSHFIRGLIGRELGIRASEESYTDTEFLFLPNEISVYKEKEKNIQLYKSIACFLWAQNWYGTFKKAGYGNQTTQDRLEQYKNPTKAKQLFLSLENIRLLANIERDLPGLYREMSDISLLAIPKDNTWVVVASQLKAVGATVDDSFKALDVLIKLSTVIPEAMYQGTLNILQAEEIILKRKESVTQDIQEILDTTQDAIQQFTEALDAVSQSDQEQTENSDEKEGGLSETQQALRALLETLLQDVEKLNYEDFNFDGDGQSLNKLEDVTSPPVQQDFKADGYIDEWDYLRQTYRKQWCRLRVRRVEPAQDNFKQEVENKYPFLVREIKRVFEAMRDQPAKENKQTDGEDIDLDAVIDMHTARATGEELSERVYIRRSITLRSVAVCLLVDMSGSTKGWINQAIRESLVLFSQALNTLGDEYAIVGFSGLTRQRCEIYKVKEFKDKSIEHTYQRIANIQAKDYTRMGFAIRYAGEALNKIEAKHRILLILSDGKPDDYDGYQGEYGIQDTRKAILEAQSRGISPYSITIDKQAQIYLPRLFGPGQYTILQDVKTLPLKLSEIYRKLSS